MALTSNRRSVLVDDVIEQLRAEITSGRWPVGQRIPPEPELLEQLGIARGTLREATRALSHAGLLQARQGDGTYVRATSELSGALQRLDSEMSDVLEVRQALDAQAARLAATRITPEELAHLGELLEQRATAWENRDRDAWVQADYAFHQRVAAGSGNALMDNLYTALGPALRRSMTAHWDAPGFDGADHRGHEELLDALRAGDAAQAARSATANIDATEQWRDGAPAHDEP
ncbi:FadR family transcriptional regulator [Saccharopolyspora indica]|uniref:FadR/GntR family transcriptional regulator n=1 Tax=Saccharopolyspora indica TaxID=1229659 RepID=UPI0022EAD0A4|nr:FadR/GntR family transcriptional regulator [Saccharopolyspora indica]MDA3649701.1 FadR/GntR family transcriptional regulator [Saccharopolyspora indica]